MHYIIYFSSHQLYFSGFLSLLIFSKKEKREKDAENRGKRKQMKINPYLSMLHAKIEEKSSSPKTYMNLFEENNHKENSWHFMLEFTFKSPPFVKEKILYFSSSMNHPVLTSPQRYVG